MTKRVNYTSVLCSLKIFIFIFICQKSHLGFKFSLLCGNLWQECILLTCWLPEKCGENQTCLSWILPQNSKSNFTKIIVLLLWDHAKTMNVTGFVICSTTDTIHTSTDANKSHCQFNLIDFVSISILNRLYILNMGRNRKKKVS